MISTRFAERFSRMTGIRQLMDDLGEAATGRKGIRMLGGGNPAFIPEVNAIWRRRMEEVLSDGTEFEDILARYDSPRGRQAFLESLAGMLNREYGWNLTARNIAVTNGSQNAFFLLLNLFSGPPADGSGNSRRILFPLCPEYIGYADQALEEGCLVTRPAAIEVTRPGFFKYRVDFGSLNVGPDIGALCVSRPTNPTGNVLTDDEIATLAGIAAARGIPLIIDNAYGAPFPYILFRDVKPLWNPDIILSMSLSKLGLPSVRTGIIVADEAVIDAVSSCNAVISLANGSLGQALVTPLIDSGDILKLSREVIRPFYSERSRLAIEALQEAFGSDVDCRIHESEGSIFLWIWLPGLSAGSDELYRKLKARDVLVVSGHYFFYGLDNPWAHSRECLRLSYAHDPRRFREAAFVIADVVRRLSGRVGP